MEEGKETNETTWKSVAVTITVGALIAGIVSAPAGIKWATPPGTIIFLTWAIYWSLPKILTAKTEAEKGWNFLIWLISLSLLALIHISFWNPHYGPGWAIMPGVMLFSFWTTYLSHPLE